MSPDQHRASADEINDLLGIAPDDTLSKIVVGFGLQRQTMLSMGRAHAAEIADLTARLDAKEAELAAAREQIARLERRGKAEVPIRFPAIAPSGILALSWVDRHDVERSLSGNPYVNVLAGERGLGMPGINLITEKLPFTAGEVARHIGIPSREIELPLHLSASSPSALEALLDTVQDWFDTGSEAQQRPGYLRVLRQDGAKRQTLCYYAGGLEGDLDPERAGDTWQDVTIQLRAPQAWATAIAGVTHAYDASDVGDEQIIVNAGHLEAFPIWTITGPASGIAIGNATTGESFALSANGGLVLAGGESLTIDTRPSSQRVFFQIYDQSLTNRFPYVAGNGTLWWLAAGENRFTISMTGTSGATETELVYLPNYRGLYR